MSVNCIAIFLAILKLVSSQEQLEFNLAKLVLETAKAEGFIDDYDMNIPLSPKVSETAVEPRSAAAPYAPVVSTTSGIATGITLPESHAFYEIRYGNSERYQPPTAVYSPTDNIDATTNDQIRCYQFETECADLSHPCNHTMTEQCLVLNVYVPTQIDLSNKSNSPPSDQLLPVMFYIHGGSFNAGAGTKVVLDGRFLANVTNSVVVTINYRLGPFGFLVFGDGDDAFKGNQGLKDQQLALKWTQDNIAKFGGDKDKVMIFGNSAGAQSVMFHLLSVTSSPYFRSSIQQSNPAMISYQTPKDSLNITRMLTDSLNCTSGDERNCLLNTDPLKIMNQQPKVMAKCLLNDDIDGLVEPYRPIIDGVEFTEDHLGLFRDGKYNTDKDIIVGINTQEMETIQYYYPPQLPFNETLFTQLNRIIFGRENGKTVTNRYKKDYPPPQGKDYRVTFGIEMTHFFFVCPSRALARFASKYTFPTHSVFFYANQHPDKVPLCVQQNNGNDSTCFWAEHAAEIVFVFRTGNLTGRGYFGTDDFTVEDEFSTYWGSFARTGSPSSGLDNSLGDFTEWPTYEENTVKTSPKELRGQQIQQLLPFLFANEYQETREEDSTWSNIRIKAPMSETEKNYEEDICDFWDSLNYYVDMEIPGSSSSPTASTLATQPTGPTQPTEMTTTPQIDSTTDSGESLYVGRHLVLWSVLLTSISCWML